MILDSNRALPIVTIIMIYLLFFAAVVCAFTVKMFLPVNLNRY